MNFEDDANPRVLYCVFRFFLSTLNFPPPSVLPLNNTNAEIFLLFEFFLFFEFLKIDSYAQKNFLLILLENNLEVLKIGYFVLFLGITQFFNTKMLFICRVYGNPLKI